jgi:hypothetical protein
LDADWRFKEEKKKDFPDDQIKKIPLLNLKVYIKSLNQKQRVTLTDYLCCRAD